MHTPAKGAGPNKGLGGSNPPFSAMIRCGRRLLEGSLGFAPIFAPILSRESPEGCDVVPDSWTKNWGPSVWDINGREQLKLES